MSDFMRPIDFGHVIDWCLKEYEQQGRIFGVDKKHFYKNESGRYYTTVFGDKLASPVGPAAGPQSQLVQNIVASYLTGARFMEVKTVQKMDGEEIRLAVKKPCIYAQDECYNCEWSTEMTVQEAFDEYLKAYFAIKVLAVELGLSDGNDFVYNISVGYDLDGIKTEKVNAYIEGMKDASDTPIFKHCKQWLQENLGRFKHFGQKELDAISPHITNSVTLSTLHGCPPEEIERIATYLLTEKGMNTFVKCNPTLLGYETARETLNKLGYAYIAFDDLHFREDLQFGDAVTMFHRLLNLAAEQGLKFGVKITNTFPVDVDNKQLPATEMYMSGRTLLGLSLLVALRLSREFEGRLPISYSGGADALNIAAILGTGIGPVTLATTILKPGGYPRFRQIAKNAEPSNGSFHGIDVAALEKLYEAVLNDPRNHKRYREKVASRKTTKPLALTDCYQAPCKDGGCPINQQIPEYLKLVSEGRHDEAISLISIDNSCPTILGVLCAQPCRTKCTRVDCEQALEIREMKLIAADNGQAKRNEAIQVKPLRSQKKAVVIGAGPAGVAAALFLRRNGMEVDVYEKRDCSYGIVRYIIPSFRITDEQMDRDFETAVREGVNFHFNADPNYDVQELKQRYDYVLLATGAWGKAASPVKEGQDKVWDALDYLWQEKNEGGLKLGKRVAIVGAGDVAMDCARVAKRCPGVEHVSIVYRRTETYMPASQDEVNLVREEGIEILELLAPVSYDGQTLRCEKMELGAYDAAGRKACVGTGDFVDLQYDDVVAATGATLESEDYTRNGLNLDERRRPRLSPSCEASIPGVYVIGDGRRGPSTIVRAVADAKDAVIDILSKEGLEHDFSHPQYSEDEERIYAKRGLLDHARHDQTEGERCLKCDQVCEICTEVCPNRANVAVPVAGPFRSPRQIVHLDGMCNECGNCAVFCPTADKPYKDKMTIFWTEQDFSESEHTGFLKTESGYRYRNPQGQVLEVKDSADEQILPELRQILQAIEKDYAFYLSPRS